MCEIEDLCEEVCDEDVAEDDKTEMGLSTLSFCSE